jgi:hypothetical protein
LKEDHNKGTFELVEYIPFEVERQVELEVTLKFGSYIILPLTSGALMRKGANFKDYGPYLTKNTPTGPAASSQLNSVLDDIFRKFDIYLSGDMNMIEFNLFREVVGEQPVTEEFFN